MNREIQNLLISEHLGLHSVLYGKGRWSPSSPETNLIIGIDKYERRCTHFCDGTSGYQCDLCYTHPKNYAGSLDAMHEAEENLQSHHLCYEYNNKLYNILGNTVGNRADKPHHWTWHATAAQRAEAFLKTIGKWEE